MTGCATVVTMTNQQSQCENGDFDPCIFETPEILTQKSDMLITSRGATRKPVFMAIDPGVPPPQKTKALVVIKI